jgi:pyruvate ferredoxin oxidoreductase gamma subunit
MFEIRIHSRGGEGGVTAARLLAIAAIHDGKFASACPFYGAERRGAPVVSFVRIDDRPIRVYSQIRTPDLVVVLDESLLGVTDVLSGLKTGSTILINSAHRQEYPGFATYTVDLTGIALREDLVISGSPVLDTPVLGALAKLKIITADSAKKAIAEMFADERNIKAADAAYREMAA